MEAVAQYDYKSGSPEELSFSNGDVLKILSEGDKHWYYAELKGALGLVPANYVIFELPSWYKDVSKEQICEILKSDNSTNFYIRPSQSIPNEMSLSVRIRDVQHFRILRSARSMYYLWNDSPKFESINKLVQYYKNHSVCSIEDVFLKSSSNELGEKRVIAEYDFTSRDDNEMSIYQGDIITFIEAIDKDWSKGSVTRNGIVIQGLYPNSYVRDA